MPLDFHISIAILSIHGGFFSVTPHGFPDKQSPNYTGTAAFLLHIRICRARTGNVKISLPAVQMWQRYRQLSQQTVQHLYKSQGSADHSGFYTKSALAASSGHQVLVIYMLPAKISKMRGTNIRNTVLMGRTSHHWTTQWERFHMVTVTGEKDNPVHRVLRVSSHRWPSCDRTTSYCQLPLATLQVSLQRVPAVRLRNSP